MTWEIIKIMRAPEAPAATGGGVAAALESEAGDSGLDLSGESVDNTTLDKADPADAYSEPLGGSGTRKPKPADDETVDVPESDEAEAATEGADAGGDEKSVAVGGSKRQAAAPEPKVETNMDLIRSVFGKSQVDAAEKRGPAALELLHSMAEDQLDSYLDPKTQGDPSPAGTAVPATPSAAQPDSNAQGQRSLVPKFDEEGLKELRENIGEKAYAGTIAPIVESIRQMEGVFKTMYHAIMASQQDSSSRVIDQRIDAFADDTYGSSYDDLSPKQEKARKEVVAVADAIYAKAQQRGDRMPPMRALALARAARARDGGQKAAVKEVQEAVRTRARSVGAVPAASASTRRAPVRSTDSAVKAVAAKMRTLGYSDPDS